MRIRYACVVAALAFAALAAPAAAQGVGFTGGGTLDPAQGYVGSYIESAAINQHLRLRPGIDGAFGNGTSEALIDFAFLYEIPFGPFSPWFVYQGTGPTVTILRVNDERRADAGFLGIFGIGNKDGFFFEVKVSGGGGPNLRAGVGYTIRRKQP